MDIWDALSIKSILLKSNQLGLSNKILQKWI